MALIRSYSTLLIELTSNKINVLITSLLSLVISWYSFNFNKALPKPETFLEIGKYYFGNPGPYFGGLFLNLVSSLFIVTLGLSFIYFAIRERDIYQTWYLVFTGLFGLCLIFTSVYFWGYFFLLLTTLVLMAIGGYFILKALDENNR